MVKTSAVSMARLDPRIGVVLAGRETLRHCVVLFFIAWTASVPTRSPAGAGVISILATPPIGVDLTKPALMPPRLTPLGTWLLAVARRGRAVNGTTVGAAHVGSPMA